MTLCLQVLPSLVSSARRQCARSHPPDVRLPRAGLPAEAALALQVRAQGRDGQEAHEIGELRREGEKRSVRLAGEPERIS